MELGIYTFGELTDDAKTPAERLRDLIEEIELAERVDAELHHSTTVTMPGSASRNSIVLRAASSICTRGGSGGSFS